MLRGMSARFTSAARFLDAMKLSPLAEKLISKAGANQPATGATIAAPSPVPAIPTRRKLVPMSFVAVLSGLTEDEILSKIESGEIYPAWNVAVNPARPRREVRIWRDAAVQFQSPNAVNPVAKLEDIITAALPPLGMNSPRTADIKLRELAYRFSVSDLHLVNLIVFGALRESGPRSKKTESRRVAYESAAQFLMGRVL